MATVANIALSVTARTRGMQRGLRGAQKRVGRFASGVARETRRIVGLGGALTALAAGAGMTTLIKRQFDAIDATTKLADRLGDSTERLSAMQHAAELSGVSTERFNKNLESFSRRVGQAAAGTGRAQQALHDLGLDADELARKAPTAMMLDVADAMEKLETDTDRGRIAADLFTRQGMAMATMLGEGREGIERMMRQADELGLTFDRLGGRKIEKANDAVTRMRGAFTGAARTAAIELAPTVASAAEAVTQRFIESRDTIRDFIRTGVDRAVTAAQSFLETARALGRPIMAVAGNLETVKTALKAAAAAFVATKVAALGLSGVMGGALAAGLVVTATAFARSRAEATSFGEEILKLAHNMGIIENAALGHEEASRRVAEAGQRAADAERELAQADTAQARLRANEKLLEARQQQLKATERMRKIERQSLQQELESARSGNFFGMVDEDEVRRLEQRLEMLNRQGNIWTEKVEEARERSERLREQVEQSEESASRLANEWRAAAEQTEAIEGVLEGLDDRIRGMTMTERERTLEQLKQLDASEAQIQRAEEMHDRLADLEAAEERRSRAAELRNELEREAERVIEKQMSPMEKLAKEMERLNAMRRIGALNEQQHLRAIEDARDRYGDVNDELEKMHRRQAAFAEVDPARQAFGPLEQMMDRGGPADRMRQGPGGIPDAPIRLAEQRGTQQAFGRRHREAEDTNKILRDIRGYVRNGQIARLG